MADYLYSEGRPQRDPRFCRTHAYVAQLFASTATSGANAQAWRYIAHAWEELAAIKQRAAGQAEVPPLDRAAD